MARYRLGKSNAFIVHTGDGPKIYERQHKFYNNTPFRFVGSKKKYVSPVVEYYGTPDYKLLGRQFPERKILPAKRSRLSYFYENKALHYYSRGLDIVGNWIFKAVICWLILITICIVFLRNDNINTGLAVDKFLMGCKSFSNWGLFVKDQFVNLINNLQGRIVPIEDLGNVPGLVAIPVYFRNLIFIVGFIVQLIVNIFAWAFQLLILLVTILFR